MKKRLTILFILLLFFSCKKEMIKYKNESYFIQGKGIDIADSTIVYLRIQEFDKIANLDTTQIIDNSFEFDGSNDKPEVFGIYIDSLDGSIGLFIENDSVFIEVNKNNLSESKIKGSSINDEYKGFIEQSNQITSKTNYLFPLFQKARTENNVEKLDEINKKINAIHEENLIFTLNFAKSNPNSYIAALALQSLIKEDFVSKDTIGLIYNSFSNDVKKGDLAIEILSFLEGEGTINN